MKKIFLICTMWLLSLASIAQVKFFEGSLNDAIAKAKAEKKLVLIMGSATW